MTVYARSGGTWAVVADDGEIVKSGLSRRDAWRLVDQKTDHEYNDNGVRQWRPRGDL
jgi:hypothetical protein